MRDEQVKDPKKQMVNITQSMWTLHQGLETVSELKSKLEADKAEKSQLDQELIQHKSDRASAKKDLETATAIREKEAADFAEETGSQKADLDAMTGAIAALEKGMGASFLQSQKARVSRVVKAVKASQSVDDFERDEILGLLQGKNPFGDYSARSGEITGILKDWAVYNTFPGFRGELQGGFWQGPQNLTL